MNGAGRKAEALAILRTLEVVEVLIPVQVLGELFTVLTRKAGHPPEQARQAVLDWMDAYAVIGTSHAVLTDALELVVSHRVASWDAVILAASADSGCRQLLSEDLHHGFTWRGTTVRNPFAAKAPA